MTRESDNNTHVNHNPSSSMTNSTPPTLLHRPSQLDIFRNSRSQYEAFLCSQTRPSIDRAQAMKQYLNKWNEDWTRMGGVDEKSNAEGKPKP
ncbi:MAG: hypothetical protein FRX48_01715 [Lasallia pustulata]|uniref:Uncharacterized protein n=1 Tax=Lasallia pustulata TaxID=136370 RepID=A0A5M8Q1V9_9LECA|nr:MAG: hypothetical protein FRX48_01715 [Lasallia pustulata]